MEKFRILIKKLENTNDLNSKVTLLSEYWKTETDEINRDAVLRIFIGNHPKRIVTKKNLKEWAVQITGLPGWLVDRSDEEVGNHIQTLNLLLRSKTTSQPEQRFSEWLIEVERLREASDEKIMDFIKVKLTEVNEQDRLIILKLMTGTFKSPVTKMDTISGLATALNLDHEIVSLRLFENRRKHQISINTLGQEIEDESMKIPCIFPGNKSIDHLDEIDLNHGKWMVLGKKEGIEVQLIKHGKSVHLWTRYGDLVTDKFPEIIESIPQSVFDFKCYGQIIPKKAEIPIDQLVARLNRKSISHKDISNCEATFELWEVLEGDATTVQNQCSGQPNIQATKSIKFSSKEELIRQHKNCRDLGFVGFILKPEYHSMYYLWKASSFSIKVILMHVEFGGMENAGIRSITFGVYRDKELLPITKIMEFDSFFDMEEVVSFVKENTIERFGPVRTVKPQLVYEIEFDGISKSSRRKSGLVLSNPNIIEKAGNDLIQVNNLQYLTSLL